MKMVTKVIDYKLMNGKRYYKVKWECSWELEDNLLHCQELVNQFWDFVDRVKSEDNRIPICKKARIDNDERPPKRTIRKNGSDFTNYPVVHVKLEEDLEHDVHQQTEDEIMIDNDQMVHIGGGNENVLVKRVCINEPTLDPPAVLIPRDVEGYSTVDNGNHDSLVSNKTLTVLPDSSHRFSSMLISDKRIYETMNGDSEHHSNEVAELESGEEIAKSSSDDIYEPDPNDVLLHWNNPYVRISFRCRICNEEQSFSDKDEKWKTHFLTHVEGAHQAEELTEPCLMEDVSQEAIDILQDPEKPWIQKVEYIIQTWGVNQYVRLAFLCRSCGKEQQPLHTGNWRNHYNSHKHNRPHSCQKCSKTFKSRSYLNQHLKMVHDKVEGVGLRSCFICNKVFTRRLDMQRHIADVHKIDPRNHMTQNEWEYKATVITNQAHDFQNGNNNDRTNPNNVFHETRDKDPGSPLLSSQNKDMQKGESFLQTHPTRNESRKHRKNYNSSIENLNDKRNFKHVCGICQERFKKKIDLKCHTVNIHCIDISNSTSNADLYSNEPKESLTPTMVDLVKNTSVRSINNYPHNLRGDRTTSRHAKQKEAEELIILVKEEVICSEGEGNCGNELTIDEDHPFPNV